MGSSPSQDKDKVPEFGLMCLLETPPAQGLPSSWPPQSPHPGLISAPPIPLSPLPSRPLVHSGQSRSQLLLCPKLASQNLFSAEHQLCLIRELWETEGSVSFFQGEVWLIILIRGSGEELHERHPMNELERD